MDLKKIFNVLRKVFFYIWAIFLTLCVLALIITNAFLIDVAALHSEILIEVLNESLEK